MTTDTTTDTTTMDMATTDMATTTTSDMSADTAAGPVITGVVVIGDARLADQALALAERHGWPVIAEPASGITGAPQLMAHAPLFLTTQFLARHRPDVVVTFGRFALSRPVAALVRSAGQHLAVSRDGSVDPLLTASELLTAAPVLDGRAPASWLQSFSDASTAVGAIVQSLSGLSSLTAVRDVGAVLTHDDAVLLAASRTVRDAEATWATTSARVFMNRGANGIDGLVSTAWGIAVGSGRRTVALLGDLAFLHDVNGLLAHDGVPRPRLTFVVLDNDGGGIFSSLEQGEPRFAAHFEQVFGTPHGLRLVDVARAHGIEATEVDTLEGLRTELAGNAQGVRVIVVRLPDRASEEQTSRRLKARCAEAVDALPT